MKGSNVTCRALIGGEMLVTLGICRRYPQSHSKVITEKSRGGRFLWNRNLDLGWIWAEWPTFLPS